MSIDFELARHNMIEQQVRPWEVLDARVLEVLADLRREDFVPARYRKLAFTDTELPLEHDQVMMKPVVEGRLLQSVNLLPDEDVLEIGTGSGFVTACLARLGRFVTSVELYADLAERARSRLNHASARNVRVEQADAFSGFEPQRQFDLVVLTGAVADLPARVRDWVRIGGRLFLIRGRSPAMEAVLLTRASSEQWLEESLFETDIPYLVGAEPRRRFAL